MKTREVLMRLAVLVLVTTSLNSPSSASSQWTHIRRIQVADEATWQGQPAIVFANDHYFVAHSNIVSGDWCSGNWEILVREFDADWNFVREIQITDAPTAEQHPGIGFANNKFSVVYASRATACSGGGHIYVKEYDTDWNLLRTIQLTYEGWLESYPSLRLLDGNYYVGYDSYETGPAEIYFKRYDTDWNFIEKISGLTTSDPNLQEQPNLCFGNNEWAATYISYETGYWHVYVRTFDVSWNPITKFQLHPDVQTTGRESIIFADGQYHISYQSSETYPPNPSIFINHYTPEWDLVGRDQATAGMYANGDTFLDHVNGVYLLGFGADGDVYVDIYSTLPPTLTASIDLDPDTLNLKSKGKWVTAYIELPDGYDVADIVVDTVTLEGTIPAETHPTEVGDYDNDGIPDLMVKFDRQALIEYLDGMTGEVTLTVSGELSDGTPFEGSDTITVINPGKK